MAELILFFALEPCELSLILAALPGFLVWTEKGQKFLGYFRILSSCPVPGGGSSERGKGSVTSHCLQTIRPPLPPAPLSASLHLLDPCICCFSASAGAGPSLCWWKALQTIFYYSLNVYHLLENPYTITRMSALGTGVDPLFSKPFLGSPSSLTSGPGSSIEMV